MTKLKTALLDVPEFVTAAWLPGAPVVVVPTVIVATVPSVPLLPFCPGLPTGPCGPVAPVGPGGPDAGSGGPNAPPPSEICTPSAAKHITVCPLLSGWHPDTSGT